MVVGLIILDFLDYDYVHKFDNSSLVFKFECNSLSFEVDYELDEIIKGYFPHISTSARAGIYLMYKLPTDKTWMNIKSYSDISHFTVDMSHFVDAGEVYEILIYGPIISKLTKLQVTIPEGSIAKIIEEVPNRTIVVAGGFNTYGIGCTSTSSMFSHILERKFDAKVTNNSYNTVNYLKNIYFDYRNSKVPIADVGILELDNFSQHESVIETLLPRLIPLMKQRCKYLIGWYSISNDKAYKKIIANNTIKEFIYNADLEIVDISCLYDEDYNDMCVYSNVYINDTGNIMIYKKLEEVIRRLTKWNI